MGKAKIFLFFLVGIIIGVGFASFSFVVEQFYLFLLIVILVVILVFSWKYRVARLILLCCMGFVLGMWRYNFSDPVITKNNISFYNGLEKNFYGIVIEEPDIRKDHVKLTVQPEEYSGKVLINNLLYPTYEYGDLVDINCDLEVPERIEDFAYDKYLSRFGIYSICYRPNIKLISSNNGSKILSWLYGIKGKFVSTINKVLPEPHASFLGGLLLGAKRGIPDDLMNDFNTTGTTHIVAISGYNITIIAVLMLSLCKNIGIPRKKAFWVIIIALIFFMLITGAQASVVRAVIMGTVVLVAKQLGRLSRITNALILTAVIMLMINPKILIFDAGFQLSFLATMGLIYLSPSLEKKFTWLPNKFQIRESFLATLSATIFTLPLILYQFGRLSVVALIVNVLILPVIPISMGFGFAAGLLSSVWLPIGKLLTWIVWSFLTYIIWIVEIFSLVPFASIEIPNLSWTILVIGYVLIIMGMKYLSIINKQSKYNKVA